MLWGHMLVGHELNSYYIIVRDVFAVKAVPVFSDFNVQLLNLESSVEQREGCVWGGAGQGTATRNSHSIARSCNAGMRHPKRAIHGVALLT